VFALRLDSFELMLAKIFGVTWADITMAPLSFFWSEMNTGAIPLSRNEELDDTETDEKLKDDMELDAELELTLLSPLNSVLMCAVDMSMHYSTFDCKTSPLGLVFRVKVNLYMLLPILVAFPLVNCL